MGISEYLGFISVKPLKLWFPFSRPLIMPYHFERKKFVRLLRDH